MRATASRATGPSQPAPTGVAARQPVRRTGLRPAISGGLAGVLGVVPHVLHHVTFLAGTALVAGSGGTAVFAAVGLVVSVPLLLRLHRRFGTWVAPAIALAVFAALFALSAFVIGPAISGSAGGNSPTVVDHNSHH